MHMCKLRKKNTIRKLKQFQNWQLIQKLLQNYFINYEVWAGCPKLGQATIFHAEQIRRGGTGFNLKPNKLRNTAKKVALFKMSGMEQAPVNPIE